MIAATKYLLFAGCLSLLVACGSHGQSPRSLNHDNYKTVQADLNRDTAKARQLNAKAAELILLGKLDEAEQVLKQALIHDVMFGPAHNNLGRVYYQKERYYLAAWEFKHAAKLMPHKSEPKNNLGMVFEAAGKYEQAISQYDEAVSIEPDNAELIGNLARVRVRNGERSPEVKELLTQIIIKDTRPEWINWARDNMVLMFGRKE